MKFQWILLLIFLSIFSVSSTAYNKIYEFDDNEDIIINTVVYNTTGLPCLICTCNLTVFNPYPENNIINRSNILENRGNGVYSINLNKSLTFNQEIYPITLVCNDSSGFMGGDDRTGIKVGETLFDYTSTILVLIAIGGFLMFSSFKISVQNRNLQMISYFMSFPFFIGAAFTALEIVKHSPDAANFIIIFDIMFYSICAVFLILIYFRFIDLFVSGLKRGGAISGEIKVK